VMLVFTCADAGVLADKLIWTNWGQPEATATGVLSAKTCDPDCASGGREEYPVTLVASELRDCAYGKPQYTKVTWTLPAGSPFPPGSPGAEDPTQRFPCPKRPHADPRIASMRMRMSGHGAPGKNYYVRVSVRLRVCGVRGGSDVVINETIGSGKSTWAEHTHTERFRQLRACQFRTFTWKLRDEFFGVGIYKVAATVCDKDAQFSKTRTRQRTTID
jgi:hypothetical protein